MQRYAAEADGHLRELGDLLGLDGVEVVRAELSGRSRSAAQILVDASEGLAFQILAAPPSRRERILRPHAATRELLLYCCIVWGRRAARLLAAIDRYGLQPGPSYRQMTRAAARAAADLLDPDELWPFPGPEPFAD